jgi:DNA-directed RNA polymerase subunit E'/Rpb7
MADNIFMKMLLNDKVKLEPAFLSKRYKEEVLRRLKLRLEGVCSRHGFIKPNSIQLHKVCIGKVELISLNGNVQFDVSFYADICNPLIGSVIKSKVLNVNKFGILAESEGVVEIIVAKNSIGIQSEIDLNRVRIGDELLIEVVGKKFELNDKKISLIGRVVKDAKAILQSNQDLVEDEGDGEGDDDVQEGGENDEEDRGSEVSETESTSDKTSGGESTYEDDDTESELSGGELEEELDGNFFSDEEDLMDGGDDAEGDAEDGDEQTFDDDASVVSDE